MIESTKTQKAVFLDRDGTIIEDIGYPHKREHVRILPKVGQAISLLNRNGFKVIVITNQAGVAKGYFTEDTVKEINEYIRETLAQQEANIDAVYYCPHHTEGIIEEYKIDCSCRKPKPGLIDQATRDFDVDLSRSYVVGDKASDVEAGCLAGCKTILLGDTGSADAKSADFVAPDLYEAVKWVITFDQER